MNNYIPDFYIRLELNANATEKDVKRAYSKRLKRIDQVTQTDEFLLLRQDYELALAYAKYNVQSNELNQQDTENNSNNNNESNSFDPAAPTNSQSINPTIDHEVEADNVDRPGQSSELNFNSELNLNNQTKTEIDIQNQFEDQINNKRKFYQKPEKLEIPFDLMLAFVQEVKNSYANQASLNDHLVLVLLKKYLAKDEFVNLEITEHFEIFLAEKLLSLEFGIFNLPILKIFAHYFNWYDSSYQSGRGKALVHMSYIAHQIDKSTPAFLHALNRILQIPNQEQSATILKFYKELYILNKDIINFCVPPDHMQKWKIAKNSRLFIFNWFVFLQDQWNKKSDMFRGIATVSFTLLAVFFLMSSLTDVKRGTNVQDQYATEKYNKCDAIYADAMNKKWQSLSLLQASQLHECSSLFAPQVCESREQFERVLSAARVLYPIRSPEEPYLETVNLKDVYLNSNGLHYEFDANADCTSVHSFVTKMRWDQSPDEKALAKMIPVYQGCYENAMETISPSKENTDSATTQSHFYDKLKMAHVFNNLASATLYNYFNNSIYSTNSVNKSATKLTAKQILKNAKPIPVLSVFHLHHALLKEKNLELLTGKLNFSGINLGENLKDWSPCIPLEKAKNLDQQLTQKVGPEERASIQKMLESKLLK